MSGRTPRAVVAGGARRAQRRLLAVFLALIAAILVLVGAGLVVSEDINRNATEQYVERALPLRSRVQTLVLQVTSAQSAVRGYILTGEPENVDLYRRDREAALGTLAFLERNAGRDPALGPLVRQAEPQIQALQRYFDAQIARAARGEAGVAAARRLIGTRGEPLFARFRATAGLMLATTDRAVREAQAQQDRRTRNLRALLSLVGLGALALAVGLALVVPRRAGRLLDAVEADRAAVVMSEARTRRLQEVTAAMAGAPRMADIVELALQQGREATGAAAGSIALLDPTGETLQTAGLVGYPPEVTENFPAYPVDASLPISDAVRDGSVWLGSTEEVVARYPHLSGFQSNMDHGGVAALPLLVDGRPIGGLALSFPEPRAFPAEERLFLRTLADLCAQALDRARLYEVQAREAERKGFLAEASVLLGASLEPTRTLTELTRLAVPRLADWCTVAVPGVVAPETVAVAHIDPDKVRLAEELGRRYPPRSDAATGAPAVLRGAPSQLVPVIPDEMLVAGAQDEEHLAIIRALGLRSGLIVPLVARGRVLGALTLISAESGRIYDESDLAFAEDLGRRAGVAMENARLYANEHHIAATLQQSLLPGRLPAIPGAESAARYVAAGGGEVGGDFYDLFELEDGGGWAAVLGDVCGKGPEAASLTALARHTLRAESDLLAPGVVLGRLNAAVLRQRTDARFLTAVYVWLRPADTGLRAVIASGGHPPALVLRRDGRVDQVKPAGPLIGVFGAARYAEEEAPLEPGDALVLYSDGVIEARTPGPERRFFGLPRLSDLLTAHAGASAEELAGGIETALVGFQQEALGDDVALLVVRAADEVAADPVEAVPVGARAGAPVRSPAP